jgi:hypothetical protein
MSIRFLKVLCNLSFSAAGAPEVPAGKSLFRVAVPPQRLNSLLKNSSFVSGHRFSDAGSSLNSDAPLGAGHSKRSFSANCKADSKTDGLCRSCPLRHPKSSTISSFSAASSGCVQDPHNSQSDCRMRRPYHFGAISHLGTAPPIPLTQFENQEYRFYVIQVFSSG